MKTTRKRITDIYKALYKAYGPQGWWPAKGRLEVIIGAILTQNTSWSNVEKAIVNLKKEKVVSVPALTRIRQAKLARLIRPAGYFNIKAARIKNFIKYLNKNYQGSLIRMFKEDLKALREQLLDIKGIGPETADSILLYAGGKPIFVIDAYTKRILLCRGLARKSDLYDDIQRLFMGNLKKDARLFNEYHALLVKLGKDVCRKKPLCRACPVSQI